MYGISNQIATISMNMMVTVVEKWKTIQHTIKSVSQTIICIKNKDLSKS